MTFKEGLVRARSHIITILGLLTAVIIVLQLEKLKEPARIQVQAIEPAETTETLLQLPPPTELTLEELKYAAIAWKYFETNTDASTGLVNSVDKYPSTTMWDTGSYLLALISAGKLNIINQEELDQRLNKVLKSLSEIPLCLGLLPNKAYNVSSLMMVDYTNEPAPNGTGWSAFDIARMMVALNAVVVNQPYFAPQVMQIMGGWEINSLITNGHSHGYDAVTGMDYRERMIGYEQYFVRSVSLFGLDASRESRFKDMPLRVAVEGIELPVDLKESGGSGHIVAEPFFLMGLEFGYNYDTRPWADRILNIQKARYESQNILTAATEDHIDHEPWFVYNSIYYNNSAWQCISKEGILASASRTLSTKAAFAWNSIYRNDYTGRLVTAVEKQFDPNRGWFGGIYEKDGTPSKAISCNTNAVILEALCYKSHGPLLSYHISREKK